MGWLKRKKSNEQVEQVKSDELSDLDLFQVVTDGCQFCGVGPQIKYEPRQFKVQCWNCRRISDKVDVFMHMHKNPRRILPDSQWISRRIEHVKKTGNTNHNLFPRSLTDLEYRKNIGMETRPEPQPVVITK